LIAREDDLAHIPKVIDPDLASMFGGPATALRLLDDFVKLKAGDVIIQNGANGAVGMALLQIANKRGIRSINIIRGDRPDYGEIVERMKSLGGDVVIPDDYLMTHSFRATISDLPKPRLALNNVGGPTSTEMARLLGFGGTMVTYGGALLKGIHLASSLFLFKEIQLRGFWFPSWLDHASSSEKQQLVNQLVELCSHIKLFGETFDFQDFPLALSKFKEPFRSKKVLLKFN